MNYSAHWLAALCALPSLLLFLAIARCISWHHRSLVIAHLNSYYDMKFF